MMCVIINIRRRRKTGHPFHPFCSKRTRMEIDRGGCECVCVSYLFLSGQGKLLLLRRRGGCEQLTKRVSMATTTTTLKERATKSNTSGDYNLDAGYIYIYTCPKGLVGQSTRFG